MSKFCVKKPYTVLVGIVMVLVLGFISFTRITTDLLPSITLPYVLAITTYPGATPEKVENSVTEPLESSLGTVNGVKNVTSNSAENYSLVILEFEEDTNMDSAMVKLSTAVEQLSSVLPDEAGTPMLMELSPDMIPTMTVSLDYDGMDVKELSKFAEDILIPYLERQDGVASVNSTGLTEEKVEIRLNQAKGILDGHHLVNSFAGLVILPAAVFMAVVIFHVFLCDDGHILLRHDIIIHTDPPIEQH